jgi:hypothetical protein
MNSRIDSLEKDLESLQQYGRRNSLRFHNVPMNSDNIQGTDGWARSSVITILSELFFRLLLLLYILFFIFQFLKRYIICPFPLVIFPIICDRMEEFSPKRLNHLQKQLLILSKISTTSSDVAEYTNYINNKTKL